MTANAINIDTLNDLFDNQNKLDDLFDSIFDDEAFVISSVSTNDFINDIKSEVSNEDIITSEDMWIYSQDDSPKKKSMALIILPVVVEIAAIYYAISYFS